MLFLIALIFLKYSKDFLAIRKGVRTVTIKPCPTVAPLLSTFKNR